MSNYNLGFGNSPCVREALLDTWRGSSLILSRAQIEEFDYPDRLGDPELVAITRQVIKRQIGKQYKHVFLTNGATGGVVITLRALHKRKFWVCHTRPAPYYARYPGMISSGNMTMAPDNYYQWERDSVILLDLPSNPTGIMQFIERKNPDIPIILDGVYFNNVYTNGLLTPPPHDVFVGSYSKLLGLNGVRIGWIATDDDLLAERMKELITAEYCGLCVVGAEMLKNILNLSFRWDIFESMARANLNTNREEWSRLEKFFGDFPVPEYGMFYYGPTDKKAKELLEKVGVTWISGETMGTDDNFGRFNLGQKNGLIREVVSKIIQKDKLPKDKVK